MLGLFYLIPLVGTAVAITSCNGSDSFSDTSDDFVSGSTGIEVLTANSSGSILVLDYGFEVEGIPSFEVLSHEGDTCVLEISYAESLAAFDNYMVRILMGNDSTQILCMFIIRNSQMDRFL